jgi:predicted DNA binding CopG/RHH family protein
MPAKISKATGKKVTFGATPSAVQLDQWVNATPEVPDPAINQPVISQAAIPESSPAKSIESIKMKRLTLDISEELHRSIKLQAVTQGISMVDLLRDLLERTYGKP